MSGKNYTYDCMVEYSDGTTERLEDLLPEERERLSALWAERISGRFSEYFSANPEEFAILNGIVYN